MTSYTSFLENKVPQKKKVHWFTMIYNTVQDVEGLVQQKVWPRQQSKRGLHSLGAGLRLGALHQTVAL